MKNSIISILLISTALFAINGCGTSEHFYPERPGKTTKVSTGEELYLAVISAEPWETIQIEDGEYILKRSLLIENKSHLTICSASADSSKVKLIGDGWNDFYHTESKENNPADLIIIRNSEDIFIADITISEVSHYGIKLDTETGNATSDLINIQAYRCHFKNIGTRAFKGTAPTDRNHLDGGSVRFCTFENSKIPDTSWLYNGDYISSIDMMYLADWNFSDNIFRNIRGANGGGRGAVFIWNQSRNIIVERNIFIGCDRSIAFGNPSEPTNYEPGSLHNYDGIIRNNFITGDITGGKGIEIVWADNIMVYNNSICCSDTSYLAIHYFQKINRLTMINNLVTGLITGEGENIVYENNLTGVPESFFKDPHSGDLHLTNVATNAMGKGMIIQAVTDDIDRQKRKAPVDIGADQK